jgi:phytol kinase
MTNTTGFIICLAYVFAIIGLSEGLRRWRGYHSSFTRKVIHIGVGMLSWAVPWLFSSPWPFVAACAGFAVLNLLDWRYGFFKSMASSDESNLGTVYFPVAAAVVTLLFWETPPIMVAALMPLAWGDGMAPVIGSHYGRHPYVVWGHRRTYEGSAGFFVACMLFTWLALWVIPGPPEITPVQALLPAAVVATVTALTEAVSVWGLDNVTITSVAIVILFAWPF